MAEDLKRNLLKKGGNFEKLFEQCVIRIQRIKQKNDYLQRKIGANSDELVVQIHEQTQFIEKQIKQIKQFMIEMQNKYRDPESKNRLKQLKLDAQKQIERNKLILKDVVVKSFIRKSKNLEEDDEHLGKIINISPQKKENKKQSMLTEQQIQIDYDVEKKILKEKNEMLNEVQQSTQRINQMMNDMVLVVEQQGDNLEMISEQMMKTNKNLMATNNDLEEASNLQKKSKKKYIILIVIIFILLIMAGGVIFFLLK